MWEHELLANICIEIWHHTIAPAYKAGLIGSREHLLALGYQAIHKVLPADHSLVVMPAWKFVKEPGSIADHFEAFSARNWLQKQAPLTFIIHSETEIIVVIEWQFEPEDYVNYRKSIRKLSHVAELGGQSALHIRLDPHTGRPDQTEGLPLADQLLCVYGVITRDGAFGLSLNKLRNTQAPERFPARFLHLMGAVREDRIRFGHVIAAS